MRYNNSSRTIEKERFEENLFSCQILSIQKQQEGRLRDDNDADPSPEHPVLRFLPLCSRSHVLGLLPHLFCFFFVEDRGSPTPTIKSSEEAL